MPNPTPRPYALNVYVSTPPSGAFQNIAPYIGKQFNPTIRFNANGLTAETTLPLHYVGNLPYSIQEWAKVQIQAIDNSEWLFNGYISKLTSSRVGPRRMLTLACLDGNIKLRRGVGRAVDGGHNGFIPTSYTWPAGTDDKSIIQTLLANHLPDVLGIYVNNVFNLSAPFSIGYCSVYDALIELRKLAPSNKQIRFYVGFAQTSGLPWHLNWFSTDIIPTTDLTLTDDPYPGANKSNYWTWQRIRDGLPIYNQWWVIGEDPLTGLPIVGSAMNTTSQGDLGVILSGFSVNKDCATTDACDTEAAKMLVNKGVARESFPGIETHSNLLLTGPQLVKLKNDLEPGLTTPVVFPIEGTEFSMPGGVPTYRADIGDRFLALGETDDGTSYGTRPTRDLTAPDPPTWLAVPPNPLLNRYNPSSNDVTLKVGWDASAAPDMLRWHLHRRRYIDNNPATPDAWDLGILIAGANTDFTDVYPVGTLIGHMLYAEDTANNISGPSLVYDVTTATDTIATPTTLVVPSQGVNYAGRAITTWAKLTANLGGYSRTPFTVHAKVWAGSQILNFTFTNDEVMPYVAGITQAMYLHGMRPGTTYQVKIRTINQWGTSSPFSTPISFTTPIIAPRLIDDFSWNGVDINGDIPGIATLSKGGSTTTEILAGTTDTGVSSFHALLGSSSEFVILETEKKAITSAKSLTWAVSVKANRNSPTGAPSGTLAYKLLWYSSASVLLNTQTVKSFVPPAAAQTAFQYYSDQVVPFPNATHVVQRLEYSATTGPEDVYIGAFRLSEQAQAVNIAPRAVTPRAQDLGIPYIIYNGDMEIPSLTGDFPDEYEVSGPTAGITYTTGSNRNLIVGQAAGSYVVRTPMILMGLYTGLPYVRVRWYQAAHALGTGTVTARCLDKDYAFISNVGLITNGALSYSFQNGVTGFVEALIPTSLLPSGTKYVRLDFGYMTSGNTPLTLDRFRTEAVDDLSALSYQFRGSAGNLISTLRVGNNAARPTFVDQDIYANIESLYIETNRVLSSTNRRLSQPSHLQMHDYTAGAQPWATGGEKLVVGLQGSGIGAHSLYLLAWSVTMFVGGTNNSTNYWQAQLRSLNNSIGFDSHATVSTQTDAPNVWLPPKITTGFTNNPVISTGRWLQLYTTAVGAPSAMYAIVDLVVCDIL